MTANATLAVKKEVVDVVESRVREFQLRGELDLPAGYSPDNAMKAAWLTLQEVKDKNGKPAAEVCTRPSISNALLSMVVQGLNPAKKQCYFIVYGNQLVLQRSYFGAMHVARTVCPQISEICADVVYSGDEFEYEKKHGRTIITRHTQKLANIDPQKLIAAYCTVIYKDGTENTTVMTAQECRTSWKKSRAGIFTSEGELKKDSVHAQFTAEMMKRTVTNRACKAIINSSDDSSIMIARQLEELTAEAAAEEMITAGTGSVMVELDEPPAEDQTQEIDPAAPADKPDF